MNKTTLMAVALATCLGYVPADAAEVVSSNIVGYQKITVPQNAMTILGVQFKTVGSDDSVSLQSFAPANYAENGTDWIKVYDPMTGRYTQAYYWGESADGGVYENADAEEPLGPGWGDVEQNVVDIDVATGQGFWTQSVSGGTLTVAGEVTADNSITIPANAMTIVTPTYPGAVSIQDIVPTDYAENGTDWIKVYDPSTGRYTQAYYWGESADGGVYENADAEEPLGPGWGDVEQNIINLTIQPGQGFWTQSVSGGTLTFPSAYGE